MTHVSPSSLFLFCVMAGFPAWGSEPPEMTYLIDNIMGPDAIRDTAPRLRALGLEAIQTYVTWETCERGAEGEWDWSAWDDTADLLAENDLRWIPILILGPAYSTPAWFREGPEHWPAQCLEHGEDSKIESLWNPHLGARVDRFLEAFARRYGKLGHLDSINLGIQGDYGEAIYPAVGGWTQNIPGEYHSHPGFWCGDTYAREAFRTWALGQYRDIALLNRAWGTDYASHEEIEYPAQGDELQAFRKGLANPGPHRRQWLDFVTWYRESMTDLADYWLAVTRHHFPGVPVYLCTGGDAPAEHGANFADQARVAAARAAGVRITNEGSDYPGNFVMTRMVASAGRYFGATFGFEPAQLEDEAGILARIFNATTSGASQLTDKDYNVLDGHLESMPPSRYPDLPTRAKAIERGLPHLYHVPKPLINTAVWFPDTSLMIEGRSFPSVPDARNFRFHTDHDYVDETLLRAGALDNYSVLVVLHGHVMERSDALLIARWVRMGGVLLVTNVVRFEDVEGTDWPEQQLFGTTPAGRDLGSGRIARLEGLDDIVVSMREALEKKGLPYAELEAGQAFAVQTDDQQWLLLNMTIEPAVVVIKHAGEMSRADVPPLAIKSFTTED